jgi:ABC-2 type transport system permease protein
MAIVPTFIYVAAISSLGMPEGNIDMGSTLGSYFGLLFLIGAYVSIGIFTSTLSDNQIVAFIIAVFLCFLFFFGFEGLASLSPNFSNTIAYLGMQDHYKSMSRGVLDSRDILYFTSIIVVFLSFTVNQLKSFQS